MYSDNHDPADYFPLPASEEAIKRRISVVNAQIEAIDADLLDPVRMTEIAGKYLHWRAKAMNARSIAFQEVEFLTKHLLEHKRMNKARRQQKEESIRDDYLKKSQERIRQWEDRYGPILQAEVIVRLHRLVEDLKPEGMEWTSEQLELLRLAASIRSVSGVRSLMKEVKDVH